MLVTLQSLRPNPFRDFKVDPIDPDTIANLRASIEQDGFWGGVVARRRDDGEIEIAAGHTRIRAAIEAGIKKAEIHVGDYDDAAMIRVYARENATQRGTSSTAVAGTVASAAKFLLKAILTGLEVSSDFIRNPDDLEKVRGNIASDKGLGGPLIARFLSGVPGITLNLVNQQLANLKASGDYSRIVAEVEAEIDAENRIVAERLAEAEERTRKAQAEREAAEERGRKAEAERKAAAGREKTAKAEADKKRAEEAQAKAELSRRRAEEQGKLAEERRRKAAEEMKTFEALKTKGDAAKPIAQKAAAKAAEREVTFDFEGVARHLKNENQVRVFRDVVTGDGVRPHLPVAGQAALAAALVRLAAKDDRELSGAFIRENIMGQLLQAKTAERKISTAERRKIERGDAQQKMNRALHEVSRYLYGIAREGQKVVELMEEFQGLAPAITGEYRSSLELASSVIDKLKRNLR